MAGFGDLHLVDVQKEHTARGGRSLDLIGHIFHLSLGGLPSFFLINERRSRIPLVSSLWTDRSACSLRNCPPLATAVPCTRNPKALFVVPVEGVLFGAYCQVVDSDMGAFVSRKTPLALAG